MYFIGLAGKIISAIMEAGFEISMLEIFHMEKANAEEFYEVYKGVVQEYGSMVSELTSGPCLALEIRSQEAPQKFREMVGPADPVSSNFCQGLDKSTSVHECLFQLN